MKKHLIFLFLCFVFFFGCNSLYQREKEPVAQLPVFEPKKPIRVALVLGGGGAKGLAHLGAIQELEAAGIRPDLIIGCSAGAIAGALYADEVALEKATQALLKFKKADLLDYTLLSSRYGLVAGKNLQEHMQKMLCAKTFDQLQIPLILIATDLATGDPVELCHGEIAPAVRASCAYPGIFQPVALHGRYLIDGGASCPMPIAIAKKYGADLVIAIDLSEKLPETSPQHLFGVAKRSLEIIYKNFVSQALLQADILIKMDFEAGGIFIDHLNEHFYEHGRKVAQSHVPAILEKMQTL